MMVFLREAWRRLLGSVAGARHEEELAAELDAHLDLLADEHRRRGLSAAEARRAAARQFGALDATKEVYRDQRGLPALDAFVRDLRHTRRLMARAPAFYLSLVLVLGGTIALCTIIVCAVHGILLRPLPYGQAARLVRVSEITPEGGQFAVSGANYLSWREARDVFDDLALFRARTFELSGAPPERIPGALVSANLFRLLRASPHLGRAFLSQEDTFGHDAVVVISHRLWQRRFDGRADIIGTSVRVDDAPHIIVGVLAEDFEFPAARTEFAGDAVEMIVPLEWTPAMWTDRANHTWRVLGRLRDGVTLGDARQRMTAVGA
jgi:hypothetical protein